MNNWQEKKKEKNNWQVHGFCFQLYLHNKSKSIINWWGLITYFIYSLLIIYQKKKYSLLKNGVCPTRGQGE